MTEAQPLPSIPPEFRHFTPRTARALVRGGYRSLVEVRAAGDDELLGLRNFGMLSLAEVRGVGR